MGVLAKLLVVLTLIALISFIVIGILSGLGGGLLAYKYVSGRGGHELSADYSVDYPGHDFGTVKEHDNDGDGRTDAASLTYDGRTGGQQSTFLYEKAGDGYQGRMMLSFEGDVTGPQRVVIPKSFASHVGACEFSVEPARVIKADPEVEYDEFDEFEDLLDEGIQIKSSQKKKKPVNALEDIAVENGLEKCGGMSGEAKILCGLDLITRYRDNEKLQKSMIKPDTNLVSVEGGVPQAVYDKNFKYCNMIKDAAESRLCTQIAFRALSAECGRLGQPADCVRKYMHDLDFKARQGVCKHLKGDLGRECAGDVDAGYCDKIKDPNYKDDCLANAAKKKTDAKLCEDIKAEYLRDRCLSEIGQKTFDESVCDKISDPNDYDECIWEISTKKMDMDLCEKIKNGDTRSMCLFGFAEEKNMLSYEFCSKLAVHDTGMTEYDADTQVTSKVIESSARDMCFLKLLIGSDMKDERVCMQIMEEQMKMNCLLAQVMKLRKFEICLKLADEDARNHCLVTTAMVLNSSEACEKISDKMMREQCIVAIGLVKKDESVCEKITDPQMKKDCERAFKMMKKLDEKKMEDEMLAKDLENVEDTGPVGGGGPCPPGFEFRPNSGVGCVQTDCFAAGGYWSYTQACICGNGKTACTEPVNYDPEKCHPFCPARKLVACVTAGGKCP
ncbi:hypothetical protein ACFLRF_02025 [Candidatus Altiarchaeota archaeon]